MQICPAQIETGMRLRSSAQAGFDLNVGLQTRRFVRVSGLKAPAPSAVDRERSDRREAVGKSVPSGGFKTLPAWL
jgi:hypothetical protein